MSNPNEQPFMEPEGRLARSDYAQELKLREMGQFSLAAYNALYRVVNAAGELEEVAGVLDAEKRFSDGLQSRLGSTAKTLGGYLNERQQARNQLAEGLEVSFATKIAIGEGGENTRFITARVPELTEIIKDVEVRLKNADESVRSMHGFEDAQKDFERAQTFLEQARPIHEELKSKKAL